MITRRAAQDRGHADHGWLDSHHTFSFSSYYDPAHMGFSDLRVINEDRVSPGQGFGRHSHKNMEIISYVLDGELEHRDSMGHGSVIRPGDVQLMSAGSGIAHSEFNGSKERPVHFLQIWILPDRHDSPPTYQERRFEAQERQGALRLLVSPSGEQGSLKILQDMRLYGALLDAGQSLTHALEPGRRAWVQVARGALRVNDVALEAGDGAALADEALVTLTAQRDAEFLLFDLR